VGASQGSCPCEVETLNIYTVAESVLEHYDKVRDYLRRGNWAGYGRELEELEEVLKEMSNITKEKK
jgi:hypothetical protein